MADIDNAIQSSNPESALQLAGLNYFVASTPTFGKELFRTDLTIGGTSVLKDLVTGTGDASPQSITVFGNRIFFVANYSYIDPIAPPGGPAITKYGLWKTDGTEVGTELVKDLGLFPILPTSAKPMVVTNNLLLFFVGDNSSGEQLWATNGSAAGTQLIKTFNPGFAPISTSNPTANTGSLFYFNRNVDTLMGSHELWRTDGTAAGTFLLRQSTGAPLGPSSTFDPSLVAVGNTVYFVSANFSEGLELWKSDGSVAGTALFKDINFGPMGAAPTGMTNVNGTLYFSADDGAVGRELWKSDGTTLGTIRVKDILTGTSFDSGINGDPATSNFTSWNNKLYFVANNGVNGTELWTSDGTSTGTQMVFDAGIGSQSLWPSKLVPMSTQMLIVTSPFGLAGQQLWVTDGTSTGTTVLSSSSGVSQSTSFFVAGNKAYFQGNQAATGNELWVSDGSVAGTKLVKDINLGAPSGLVSILAIGPSGVMFKANDGVHGNEFGFSDGTNTGTMFIDVALGTPSSNISDVVAQGSMLFLASSNGLYKSLGTAATTEQLSTKIGSSLTVVGSKVYFVAPATTDSSNQELWVTDGTSTGTKLVFDIRPGAAGSSPSQLTSFGGGVYFVADDGVNGKELWRSFGAPLDPLNTTLFYQFGAGAADGKIERIVVVGGKLFVQSDGKLFVQNANTFTQLATIGNGSMMPWDNLLYFAGFAADTGYELWRTDGTTLGTYLVSDILPGAESSFPGGGVVANADPNAPGGAALEAKLVFRANIANGTSQLFATNGTTAGTIALTNEPLVTNSQSQTASLTPVSLTKVGGNVYFEAYRQDVGRELWITNGTITGTQLVADLRPGNAPDPLSIPPTPTLFNMKEQTAFRNRLFLRAASDSAGNELWSSDGTTAGSGLAIDIVPGTVAGNPMRLTVVGNQLYLAANSNDYGVSASSVSAGELFRLNEAPYAFPVNGITTAGQSKEFRLRGLDRDDDAMTYEIVSQPLHGTVVLNGFRATYTPANGYEGLDAFSYRILDGSLYSEVSNVSIGVRGTSTQSVQFAVASQNIVERNGNYIANVTLTQPATAVTLIPYSYGFGQNRTDGIVAFAVGDTTSQILIPLLDDNMRVASGQQSLLEISLLPNEFVALGPISQHVVAISDNDPIPFVFFVDSQRTYSEVDGSIGFDVGLSNASDQIVSTTISVSFFGNVNDYIAAPQTQLTFQPGQVRQRVLVKLINDNLPEPREVIEAGIAAVTNATVTSDPNRFRSFAWIEDDDISKISLSPVTTLLEEGQSVLLTATRIGGTQSLPLTVPVNVYFGGAIAADYTLSSLSFQFTANSSTATILVSTIDDSLVEVFEALTVALTTNSSYILGETNESYIGIFDNDRTIISLEFGATNVPGISNPSKITESTYNVPDNRNWKIDVTARLSAPSSQTISVPVVANNGKLPGYATTGSDFLFSTANFVFAPGVTQITRTLEILNDTLSESDEKLQISLVPTETQFSLRKNGIRNDEGLSKQLVILNDDYRVSLDAPKSVSENSGTLNFTVSLDVAPTTYNVYVDLELSGSLSKSEYQALGFDRGRTKRITFSPTDPNPKSQTVAIQLIDDNIFEKDPEKITLSAYENSAQGKIKRSVTITDNESPPTVRFGKSTKSGFSLSSNSNAPFTIALDTTGISTSDTKIDLKFGGTAKRNVDYTVVGAGASGTLTIPANQSSTELVIYPIDNGIVDGDKILDVTLAGTLAISIPAADRTTSRTITEASRPPSSNCSSDFASYLAAFQPYALAISTSRTFESCLANNPKASTGSNIAFSNDALKNYPVGTLAISFNQQGIIKDGHVFFDSNVNGVRDFLDLNQDGRQNENEPTEPESITDLSGTFAITIPSSFDLDQSGIIETREGRLVSYGGIDTSTNLPWRIPFAAPIGLFTVTPITTLLENLMRRKSLSLDNALVKINGSLDLGDFSLTSGASIYQVLANDPTAALAYSRQVALSSTALLAASLFSGKTGDDLRTYSDQLFDLWSDIISAGATEIDLTNSGQVGQLLSALNARLSTPLPTNVIDGARDLITLGMNRVQSIRLNDFADPMPFLESLIRVKKLMHGDLAMDLNSVGAGTTTIAAVLASYTSATAPNFDSRTVAQTIGQIIPAAINVSDATVREGQNGTSIMEFTVSLNGNHSSPVSVNYSTFDGTATAASGDYTSTSGVLNWPENDISPRIIQVTIGGDTNFEIDEYLKLVLSNASNAVIRTQQGNGYIINDDAVAVVANSGGSQFLVEHGTDEMAILNDGAIIASGFFVDLVNASFTGQASSLNGLTVDYSSNTYRADDYSFVGGNATDNVTLLAGRFQKITHFVSSGSTGKIIAKPQVGDQSTIRWSSAEAFIDQVSEVDEIIVHLPQEVDNYIVDDPDINSSGQMRVRSSNGQFAPILFTVPNSKLTIVTMNRSAVRLAGSIDPSFTGTIEWLFGGVTLSSGSIAENQPIGSMVASFLTQDPTLASGYTIALVAGSGDTDNGSFVLTGLNINSTQVFDFEAKSSYSIRVRTTDPSGYTLQQVFTINITNVNESPTDISVVPQVVNENTATPVDLFFARLIAIDPDATDSFTYQFAVGSGDTDNSRFVISGDQLMLKAGQSLDFETQPAYSVRVQVKDAGLNTFAKSLSLGVVDVSEVESLQLDNGTVQRSMIRSVALAFDGVVSIDSDAFEVTKRGAGGGVVSTSFVTQLLGGKTVALISFSGGFTVNGSLIDGNYDLRVIGSKVNSARGLLDGNKDGILGDNYSFGQQAADNFFRLFGDANGSGIVDTSDLLAANVALRKRTGQSGFDSAFDFNNDGVIDTSELLRTRTSLRNRRAAF